MGKEVFTVGCHLWRQLRTVPWGSRWGGGGPDVACRILKTAMSHVSVARKIAVSHVTNEKYPCHMSL